MSTNELVLDFVDERKTLEASSEHPITKDSSDLDTFLRRTFPNDFEQEISRLLNESLKNTEKRQFSLLTKFAILADVTRRGIERARRLHSGRLAFLEFLKPSFQIKVFRYFRHHLTKRIPNKTLVDELLSPNEGIRWDLYLQDKFTQQQSASSNQQKKVLMISGMFPNSTHAGGLRSLEVLNLITEKHQTYLYCMSNLDSDSPGELPQQLVSYKACSELDFSFLNLIRWLKSMNLNIDDFDTVHLEYNSCFAILAALAGSKPKKVITIMECLTLSSWRNLKTLVKNNGVINPNQSTAFLECALREKKFAELADTVICLTDEDKNTIKAISHVTPAVVHTGISKTLVKELDEEKVSRKTQPIPYSAGFVGYYGHTPNVEAVKFFAENVVPLVRKKIPEFTFRVIGAGGSPNWQVFKTPGVVNVGRVDKLTKAILECEICVSPLISGAGFRGKVNQYAICKRPVIATSISLTGLGYENKKNVICADTPIELSEAVIQLLTDKQMSSELAQNAFVHAQNAFSWDKIGEQLDKIF